ncbi:Uncharacterised protein [Raoultella ornithinolytica]|nr:Uncharacterised protein [Raoultella ornithinolytica]
MERGHPSVSAGFSFCSSFISGPAVGVRAGCRERSQPGCLRPVGLPSHDATSTAGLQPPFRRRRPVAPCPALPAPRPVTPGCKGHRRFACRAPTLRRVPAHFLSCAFSPFKSLSPGLRQAQPAWLSRAGVAFRNKFFPAISLLSIRPEKISRSPRTAVPGRAR